MGQIRTFIAIEIPGQIRNEISRFQDELKKEGAHISWVKPQNIHITLKFLGDIDEGIIDDLAEAITIASNGIKPFPIDICGVGAFPNYRRPRVVWIGAKSENNLLSILAEKIDHEVHKLGFEKEARGFKAHLTLGRVKSTGELGGVISKLVKNENFHGGNFIANEIILMHSDLKPTGAIYTPLKKILMEN